MKKGSSMQDRSENGLRLKDFISSVKKELQDASKEGQENPFFELKEVELETAFEVRASASAQGGFEFLVKIGGEKTASETHKVKLAFSPLNPSVAYLMQVNRKNYVSRGPIYQPLKTGQSSGALVIEPVGPVYGPVEPLGPVYTPYKPEGMPVFKAGEFSTPSRYAEGKPSGAGGEIDRPGGGSDKSGGK